MIIDIVIALVSFVVELIICLKSRRLTVKLMIPIAGILIIFACTHYVALGSLLSLYSYIVYTSGYKIVKVERHINEDSLEERILRDEGKIPKWTFEYKRLLKPISFSVVLYAIQFILFPLVLSDYYPITIQAALIFVGSTTIVSLIHNITNYAYKLNSSIIFVTAYIILVAIYCNDGCYGIGLDIQKILSGEIEFSRLTEIKEIPIVTVLMYGVDMTIYMIIDGFRDIAKAQTMHNKLRSDSDEKNK